jgi:hypothetical protein
MLVLPVEEVRVSGRWLARFGKSGDGTKIATDRGVFEGEPRASKGFMATEHGGRKEDEVRLFVDRLPFWL